MPRSTSSSPQPRKPNGQFDNIVGSPPNPSPELPRTINREAESWENRYHVTFTNFHQQTIKETKRLFRSRPSQLDEDARKQAFQRWISQASAAYGMDEPRVIWDAEADYAGGGFYSPPRHSITLSPNRPSITTLLHEFRHALQAQDCGPGLVSKDLEVDARAWSLSLYYQCRPVLFQRLVREGRLLHINPQLFD